MCLYVSQAFIHVLIWLQVLLSESAATLLAPKLSKLLDGSREQVRICDMNGSDGDIASLLFVQVLDHRLHASWSLLVM